MQADKERIDNIDQRIIDLEVADQLNTPPGHVGQPIVAVVAETLAEATDATELVYVDYEPLPVVLDLEESVKGETLLFPEFGSNIVNTMSSERTADFSECEVVVEERIEQRFAILCDEIDVGVAPGEDDRLLSLLSPERQQPFEQRLSGGQQRDAGISLDPTREVPDLHAIFIDAKDLDTPPRQGARNG